MLNDDRGATVTGEVGGCSERGGELEGEVMGLMTALDHLARINDLEALVSLMANNIEKLLGAVEKLTDRVIALETLHSKE
jgi:hypothetical protein